MEPKREKLFSSFFDGKIQSLMPPLSNEQLEFLKTNLADHGPHYFSTTRGCRKRYTCIII
jgi:hypothetical protein